MRLWIPWIEDYADPFWVGSVDSPRYSGVQAEVAGYGGRGAEPEAGGAGVETGRGSPGVDHTEGSRSADWSGDGADHPASDLPAVSVCPVKVGNLCQP